MKTVNKGLSLLLSILLIFGFIPISFIDACADTSVLQQHDSRWGSYNFGGKTLEESACGLFANLNAIQYMNDYQFSIDEIHKWADYAGDNYYVYGVGSSHNITKGLATKYGKQYEYKFTELYDFASHVKVKDTFPASESAWNTLWDKLVAELKQDRVCVTLVPHHFIAIVDYNPNTDKVLVLDSYAGKSRGTTTSGDWKSSDELYYGSSEGKEKLKVRSCFAFLESTKPKTFVKANISGVTKTNATINLEISNPDLGKITEYGYYIGKLDADLNKVFFVDNYSGELLNVELDINSTYKTLAAGQTYYYYVYAVINGVTYKTKVNNFKTPGTSFISFTNVQTTKILTNNATIFSKWYASNGAYHDITEIGFYIGSYSLPMTRVPIKNPMILFNTIDVDIAECYEPLTPHTTYFYHMYLIVDDEMYISDVNMFSTSNSFGYVDGGDVDFNNAGGLKKGDINSDKFIDMSDVVVAQKIIARLADFTDFGTNSKTCADVNSDGYLTMEDVTEMQKYIAKIITTF